MKLTRNRITKISVSRACMMAILFTVIPFNYSRAQQNDPSEQSNQQQITVLADRLKKHVHYLASDALNGRKPGTNEYEQAISYAEKIFSSQGLFPFFGNTFRQPVLFIEKQYNQVAMNVNFMNEVSSIPPKEIKYFSLIDNRLFQHRYPLIYFNLANLNLKQSFIKQSSKTWKNKILLVTAGTDKENNDEPVNVSLAKISRLTETENKPAGIILITNKAFGKVWPRIHSIIPGSGYEPGLNVPKRLQFFNTDLILLTPGFADLFYKEIKESGNQPSSVTPANPFQFSKTKIQYYVPYTQTKYESWNLGGTIPGNDSLLKNEFILVGAHLDHLGKVDGKIMNGADDNASGSATILELARQLKNTNHKRSIALILWTAEESEAMGSQQFFARLPVAIDQIKWYVNFDMIGRNAPENSDSGALYISTFPEWMDDVKKTFQECNITKPPLIFSTKGLSDHFVFELYHIPNFGFYSGHHEDVHQPTDDADKLNYRQMSEVVLAAKNVILQLANKVQD